MDQYIEVLVQKFGVPLVTAAVRLLRAGAAVAASAGLTYVIAHVGDLHVPTGVSGVIVAVLLAADKWVREHVAAKNN